MDGPRSFFPSFSPSPACSRGKGPPRGSLPRYLGHMRPFSTVSHPEQEGLRRPPPREGFGPAAMTTARCPAVPSPLPYSQRPSSAPNPPTAVRPGPRGGVAHNGAKWRTLDAFSPLPLVNLCNLRVRALRHCGPFAPFPASELGQRRPMGTDSTHGGEGAKPIQARPCVVTWRVR